MTYIVQQIRSTEEGRRPLASQLVEGQFALNINDASPGIFLRTTEDNVVKVGGVSVGLEEPVVANNEQYSTGELWFSTTSSELKIFDGTSWRPSSTATLAGQENLASRISVLENTTVTNDDLTLLLAEKADLDLLDFYYTKAEIDAGAGGGGGNTLSNVVDSAQGINVTGVVASQGLNVDVGGQITAAGCSVDFGSATVSFSGASIGGLSGTIRDDIDNYLNVNTATDGQVLSWDASANAGNGDFTWVAQSTGGGGITAEQDTLNSVTTRGATTLNDITVGKIYFSNVFATLNGLPDASTYHGMFAHVHSTGHGYFAHGGNWIKLANHSELGSATAANFTWNQSLIPDTNAQYDLGSAEYKVRHLFLSDNSIKFGDAEIPLGVNEGDLEFGGIPIMPRTLDNVLNTLGVESYDDQAAALTAGLIEGDVYYDSTINKLTSVTA